MSRRKLFKVSKTIFIIYTIIVYHLFWISIGSTGFDLMSLFAIVVVILIAMLSDGLSKIKDLTMTHSIIMTVLYLLPFIVYFIFFTDGSLTTSIFVLIGYAIPWGVNAVLSAISIFLNEKPELIPAE